MKTISTKESGYMVLIGGSHHGRIILDPKKMIFKAVKTPIERSYIYCVSLEADLTMEKVEIEEYVKTIKGKGQFITIFYQYQNETGYTEML